MWPGPSRPAVGKVEPTASHFPLPPQPFLCRWGLLGHLSKGSVDYKIKVACRGRPGSRPRSWGKRAGGRVVDEQRPEGYGFAALERKNPLRPRRPKSGLSVQRRLPRAPPHGSLFGNALSPAILLASPCPPEYRLASPDPPRRFGRRSANNMAARLRASFPAPGQRGWQRPAFRAPLPGRAEPGRGGGDRGEERAGAAGGAGPASGAGAGRGGHPARGASAGAAARAPGAGAGGGGAAAEAGRGWPRALCGPRRGSSANPSRSLAAAAAAAAAAFAPSRPARHEAGSRPARRAAGGGGDCARGEEREGTWSGEKLPPIRPAGASALR